MSNLRNILIVGFVFLILIGIIILAQNNDSSNGDHGPLTNQTNESNGDLDLDGVANLDDNCPNYYNPDQENVDPDLCW